MLTSSFKARPEIFTRIPVLFPQEPTLANYNYVLTETPAGRYFLNSLYIATVTTLLSLVHGGRISMSALVDRLTVGPARVLGPSFEKYATLEAGSPADLVLFDPNLEWTVDTSQFASKGRNTPLQGVSLKGRVMATMVDGRLVHQDFGV